MADLRAGQYPPIGDQLDAIYKLAAALQQQGISLPDEVQQWIDRCAEVKRRFPIPKPDDNQPA
ncbi:hypothetical protein JL37_11075 [Achromobacter sp. RTa]|nr:hypothetical protein JL37_11075 [Achromobacter sp. RTa]